ncbi:MAG: hypothetical protein LBS41_02440 [Streptococcaceae bacterium]|jgi:Rgg/GadR/MutR family transcriptional activator|nr:hypothetical protein [Streptococcaceae bacterium]
MYYLGPAFRKIRQAKHISTHFLCQDTISSSFLSKWERGESRISVAHLIELLDLARTSFDELLLYHEHLDLHYQKFIDQLSACVATQNLEGLLLLRYHEERNTNPSAVTVRQHRLTVLTQHINQIMEIPFDLEATQQLVKEFQALEVWGLYDLTLYSHAMFFIPTTQLSALTLKAYQKSLFFRSLPKVAATIILILTATIRRLLAEDLLDDAAIFLKLAADFLAETTLCYEINEIHFLEGIYLTRLGQKVEGQAKIDGAIQVLRQLNLQQQADDYQAYLAIFD